MNKFYFQGNTTIDCEKYSINEELWNQIRINTDRVYNLFDIEQKYDLMIGNYISFEKELLINCLDNEIKSSGGRIEDRYLQAIIRKTINLVTTIIFFYEHLSKNHIKRLKLDKKDEEKINKELLRIRKISIWGRFIRIVRNFTIHFGLPLSSCHYSSDWWMKIGDNEDKSLGHKIIPIISHNTLLRDKNIEKDIDILELIPSNKKGEIDLRLVIRKSISELNNLIILIRDITEVYVKESEEEIERYISLFMKKSGSNNDFCMAIKDENKEKTVINLYKEVFSDLEKYKKSNVSQGLLERRYIHNRIDDKF